MGSRGVVKSLTGRQVEILVGTLLGDGCLEVNGRNVRLKVDHGVKQKAYVFWKYNQLKQISLQPYKITVRDSRTKKLYTHYRFATKSIPELWEYYRNFYENGRRRIPSTINRILKSPLSLAVWYMDDGHRRTDCQALRLNSQTYSLKEQEQLREVLTINFGVKARIHKVSGETRVLYLPVAEAKRFCKIIEPYIIASMKYKLL